MNPTKSELAGVPRDQEVSFLPMEAVGFGGETGSDETRLLEEVYDGFTYFRNGDVLVAKITPSFENGKGDRAVGLINGIGFGTTELHVLRPHAIDGRYLSWLVQSRPFRQEGKTWMRGAAGQQRVPTDFVADFRLPVVDGFDQRAIADFLDRETDRIDELVSKKQRLIELLEEQWQASFLHDLRSPNFPRLPLRRVLTHLTDGPFGSAFRSSDYSDEGAAVVRLGNIGFAEYRDSNQAFVPMDLYRTFLRHRVQKGDLLIAGLGDARNHAGRACIAPDLGPAIVKGKCFCARLDRRKADPTFVALVLSSPLGADIIALEARGSTRSMINLDIVKSAILPLPSLALQVEIARRAVTSRDQTTATVDALKTQLDLLAEYRQALITAAVTGQIDVSGEVGDPEEVVA